MRMTHVTDLAAAIETPRGGVLTHQGCLRWRRLVVTWRNSEHVYYRGVWRSASRYLASAEIRAKEGMARYCVTLPQEATRSEPFSTCLYRVTAEPGMGATLGWWRRLVEGMT